MVKMEFKTEIQKKIETKEIYHKLKDNSTLQRLITTRVSNDVNNIINKIVEENKLEIESCNYRIIGSYPYIRIIDIMLNQKGGNMVMIDDIVRDYTDECVTPTDI